jgi:hypothetical protein
VWLAKMFDFYSKNIIYNYVKLASLLLAYLDVPVVSCAAVNPAVGDVLPAVEVPTIAMLCSWCCCSNPADVVLSAIDVAIISDITAVVNVPAMLWLTSLLSLPFLLLSEILFLLSSLL